MGILEKRADHLFEYMLCIYKVLHMQLLSDIETVSVKDMLQTLRRRARIYFRLFSSG
jgi:hypothetical protein